MLQKNNTHLMSLEHIPRDLFPPLWQGNWKQLFYSHVPSHLYEKFISITNLIVCKKSKWITLTYLQILSSTSRHVFPVNCKIQNNEVLTSLTNKQCLLLSLRHQSLHIKQILLSARVKQNEQKVKSKTTIHQILLFQGFTTKYLYLYYSPQFKKKKKIVSSLIQSI